MTTNAIIVFILYFYMYFLESKSLLIFIRDTVFIKVVFIYFNVILLYLIEFVFIHIYSIGSGFLLFNTCNYKIY